jgi:hypothetical protein
MTTILQINGSLVEQLHQRADENYLSLLASYQMIPQLVCESVIDRAIASIECTAAETAQACQQLYQQWGLTSEEQQHEWRTHYGFDQKQFEQLATRSLRIERFKQITWEPKLESYFLQRKHDLDKVIYSLLRTKQRDIIQELYFRIQEEEQSFVHLAQQYSEGSEAETGGLIGPVELGTLNIELAELLRTGAVGRVESFGLGEWHMLVRLEKRIPAQLDDSMRQRLLNEQFSAWLQTQIEQLCDRDKVWLGIALDRSTTAPQVAG